MTLRFTQIDTTSLDAIEASVGAAAVLEFFSADPAADPSQPDQGILLARIYLPDDWMANESGGSKAKQGTWEGQGVEPGDIRSFRLKRSDGVCVCEGTVTATGGGGDLTLNRVGIGDGQKIRVTAFTLAFQNPAVVLDPRDAAITFTQAANTVSSTAFNAIPVVVTADTWIHRSAASEALPLYSEGMGPATHQGWYKGCLIETTGDLFFAQGTQCALTNANCTMYGTFIWNNSTGQWSRVDDRLDTRWFKHFSNGIAENYETAYDPTRHCVWFSEGGPGWGNPGDGNPRRGQLRFDLATLEYFNHRPSSNYVPVTQDDTDHFFHEARDGPARLIGFDDCIEVIDGKLYNFGGWNTAVATLRVIDPATEVRPGYAISTTTYPTTNVAPSPSWNGDDGVCRDRSGQHRKEKYLWTVANLGELYVLNLNEEPGTWKWRHVPTTGPKPISRPVTGTTQGVITELHEDANCIVAYCGRAHTASEVGTLLRQTWVLDLATRRWRHGPSAANGDTVPTGQGGAVTKSMFYSPAERVVRLMDGGASKMGIWDFVPEYTGRGTITSFELIDNPTATVTPYEQGGSTKHTNMAYCPPLDRIYVSGGDVTGTAAPDWTWSMDVATGEWRRDAIRVDGVDPHPVAAQDGMGFFWDDAANRGGTGRNKFLFLPGAYIQGGTTPTHTWARGWWTFDPYTNEWEQFTGLWGTLGQGSGNLFGGCWNPDDDIMYIVGNSSGSKTTVRYHLGTQTQLDTLTWANGSTFMSGTNAAGGQFTSRGQHVLHNGYIYVLGTATTDGVYRFSVFCRYHIATNTIQRLATPPVRAGYINAVECRIALSGSKIVWPAANGPDGEFGGSGSDAYYGMCVYDIETDTWVRDEQVPAYGNFCANSVMRTALPDGRVCMAGSVFGRPQTHFWMYRPAS